MYRRIGSCFSWTTVFLGSLGSNDQQNRNHHCQHPTLAGESRHRPQPVSVRQGRARQETDTRTLQDADPDKLDTTLLILPYLFADFLDFNDFLDTVDIAVAEPEFNDEFQVASLHPQYQFSGTVPDDIENYTNRSPYPTLHLLREDSVDRAVAAFPDAGRIVDNNIGTMNKLGREGWKKLGLDVL
jgi:hypothetical protein